MIIEMTPGLAVNIASVLLILVTAIGGRPFVRSVVERTCIGRLRIGDGRGFGEDIPAEIEARIKKLQQRLEEDFLYVLEIYSCYLGFAGCILASLLIDSRVWGVLYTIVGVLCFVVLRYWVEGLDVRDYFHRRWLGIRWSLLVSGAVVFANSGALVDQIMGF